MKIEQERGKRVHEYYSNLDTVVREAPQRK